MMNRILLSLLSGSMIISNTCAQYDYNDDRFNADIERLSKDNPKFMQKFEQTKANLGESARHAATHSIFYTRDGVIYATVGALCGTIAGHFVDKKAIVATIGGVAGMVAGTSVSINDWVTRVLNNERWYKRDYGEESPEAMAAIWTKHNKWATLFLSSKNSSKTIARNKHFAELKKAMQENPQFKEDFINRVKIGAKAARHDAAKTAVIGAKFGAKYGAIGGAIAGTIAATAIAKRTLIQSSGVPVACPTAIAAPIGAAVGSVLGAVMGVAVGTPVGAIAGAVDSLNWGCFDCGRRVIYGPSRHNTNHDATIQHNQDVLTDSHLANEEARAWASEHKLRTLFTLVSDKPMRNALDAEFDL